MSMGASDIGNGMATLARAITIADRYGGASYGTSSAAIPATPTECRGVDGCRDGPGGARHRGRDFAG
jgi:hypothetical protein